MSHPSRRAATLLAAGIVIAACQPSGPAASPFHTASAPPASPMASASGTPTAGRPSGSCADHFTATDGRIAFSYAVDGLQGIATVNADGSDFRFVVEPGLFRDQPTHGAEAPRWTPDNRILFGSNLGSAVDDARLFLVDAAGGELQQLTSSPDAIEYFPAISADGALLAYGKGYATGNAADPYRHVGIFISEANGQNERQLTVTPEGNFDEWPDFSPDGTLVAFTRHLGGQPGSAVGSIVIVNVDGTNLRQITDPELNAIRPRWSPDGSFLVFSSNSDNFQVESANVWMVAPDGSGLRQLTFASVPSQGFFPDVSADGENIVYINHTGGSGTQDLAILSLDGSAHCILFAGGRNRLAGDMDWGP